MKSNATTLLMWGAFLLVLAISVQAQVNFSPAWGKRGAAPPMVATDHFIQNLGDCRLPFDGMTRLLKLIQFEAQRLIRCEGMPPETTD